MSSGGFDISAFRSQLTGDMARPSQFYGSFTSPIDNSGYLQAPFRIAATALPEYKLGVAEVSYFGRKLPLAGDREFKPWTTVIYNDEDFILRNALEGWSNTMNALKSNIRQLATSSYTLYQGTGSVTQFSKTGIPIRTYQFSGIWPSVVSDIEVGWSMINATEAFTVTWQYNWFEVVAPTITGIPAPGSF
jgi:hypothetical protein